MTPEDKLISAFAHSSAALGFRLPTYKRPKWYQFKLRRLLRYYDQHNLPYTLE